MSNLTPGELFQSSSHPHYLLLVREVTETKFKVSVVTNTLMTTGKRWYVVNAGHDTWLKSFSDCDDTYGEFKRVGHLPVLLTKGLFKI